jgi:hypothetical protein
MSASVLAATDGSRREEDSIGRAQLGPTELTTQHRKLVAEHDDLEFLELIRAEAQRAGCVNSVPLRLGRF